MLLSPVDGAGRRDKDDRAELAGDPSGLIVSRKAWIKMLVGKALTPSEGMTTSSRHVGQVINGALPFWAQSCRQSRQKVCWHGNCRINAS